MRFSGGGVYAQIRVARFAGHVALLPVWASPSVALSVVSTADGGAPGAATEGLSSCQPLVARVAQQTPSSVRAAVGHASSLFTGSSSSQLMVVRCAHQQEPLLLSPSSAQLMVARFARRLAVVAAKVCAKTFFQLLERLRSMSSSSAPLLVACSAQS